MSVKSAQYECKECSGGCDGCISSAPHEDTSRKQLVGALKSISSTAVRKIYRDMDKASLEPPVVRVLLYSRVGKILYTFLDITS